MEKLMIDLKATGKRIKEKCEEKGVKPTDLQELLGFSSPAAIYKWYCGVNAPTIDNLFTVARYLEVRVDELVVFTKG